MYSMAALQYTEDPSLPEDPSVAEFDIKKDSLNQLFATVSKRNSIIGASPCSPLAAAAAQPPAPCRGCVSAC
jgi:hypothetical protein